eukprot:CAMPEP_0201538752 /NCGR_PEP_ID=MMETSP0161_2-20130828/68494_1 /ASSEMBLY_ACC=CAM_ASM_000251 /TAXON_ID=180227 /ORGANISM="Neoparamoeba aestuarina, Strain SoJaBio B1-5/56/2" /LENGTH=67 /DNA_ID=CAMNT_0047945777 /DNA_START=34 /DNA_END=234 /DNA_ORIENTATION=-
MPSGCCPGFTVPAGSCIDVIDIFLSRGLLIFIPGEAVKQLFILTIFLSSSVCPLCITILGLQKGIEN